MTLALSPQKDSNVAMVGSTRMKGLTSIVAIDERGAIGCRNALPWSLKSDMAFFRKQTLGNTVIMGRKTYDSIGGCLAGRNNIVLSHNNVLFAGTDSCRLALSVQEALFMASRDRERTAYVIGGAVTYQQFAHLVDRYLVTMVHHIADDADAFLEKGILENFKNWDRVLVESYPILEGKDQYAFDIYEIIPPDVQGRLEMQEEEVRIYASNLAKKAVAKATRVRGSASNIGQQDTFSFL